MRRSTFPLALVMMTMFAARPSAAQDGCTAEQGVVLAISTEPIQAAPGESVPIGAYWYAGGYRPADPVPATCGARWSVEPAGAGRVADGRLSVSASTPPGAEMTVMVRVGQSVARQAVHVVDPRPNPLAANWAQADSAACTGGPADLPKPEPVRELILRRDSAFSLTAVPFESYRDYWGRYAYDSATGALRLTVDGGNHHGPELDLEGTARVHGDTLELAGFWLGDPRQERAGRTCTYVFTRAR